MKKVKHPLKKGAAPAPKATKSGFGSATPYAPDTKTKVKGKGKK